LGEVLYSKASSSSWRIFEGEARILGSRLLREALEELEPAISASLIPGSKAKDPSYIKEFLPRWCFLR
jgi:hypothetical protein